MRSLANRIRYLISKGKIKEALNQLQHIDAFEEDLQTKIYALNGRYHQLEHQEIKGISSREAINLENNRITNALLLLIDDFPDNTILLTYKLNRLAKSLAISIEQVETVMAALEERYQSRLHQKMDNYLSLSLQLSYTQEGTAQRFVETFFDEESKGTDFINKNCLEVLKQHQHLLILGNPGAGKTTLLLQLANSLLQQYEELQIPIVFNLASWTAKESSFKQWLQNVLVNGYGFSAEFAAKSLAQNTILPLLDGFDEIGKANKEATIQNDLRQHCLEAIGQYVSNENVHQFIICSRRKEYEAVPQNAPIRAEILVNPLSIQQIEAALTPQKNKAPTNKERTLMNKLRLLKEQQHPVLEILCTPFYFNLIFDTEELTHALGDIDQLSKKKAEIEQYLLSEFIHNKINSISHFSKSKTTHYLSWLAYWMNGREAVSFELADLQPDVLKRRWLFGLIGGLVGGLISCFVGGLEEGLELGLVIVLNASLVFGLIVVLNKILKIKTEDIRQTNWFTLLDLRLWQTVLKQTIKRALQVGLFFGLIFCLGLGLIGGLDDGYSCNMGYDLIQKLIQGLVFGLLIGLIIGLVFGLVEHLYQAVTTISFYKIIETPYTRLKSGWQIYFFQSLLFGILNLFLFILFFNFNVEDVKSLAVFILIFIFPVILLILTKIPLVQHSILRIALTIEKKAPLKYVQFLNAATKARILEKDGGHWRFRHQLIQDYFAQLYKGD